VWKLNKNRLRGPAFIPGPVHGWTGSFFGPAPVHAWHFSQGNYYRFRSGSKFVKLLDQPVHFWLDRSISICDLIKCFHPKAEEVTFLYSNCWCSVFQSVGDIPEGEIIIFTGNVNGLLVARMMDILQCMEDLVLVTASFFLFYNLLDL